MQTARKRTTPRPRASDRSDPWLGRRLGERYLLRRIIGRGGVGVVYLASQRDTLQEVVVKVLAPNWLGDAEAVARFEREATRLGGLRHPNIVSMLDHGHEEDQAYLVMEYVRGELLSERLARDGPLSIEEFVPIAAQILKGIGHAHSRELMVRDIKPSNVMLCERKGRTNFVKILDFGLAKRLRDETPITAAHVLGTVGYLAPEAIEGKTLDLRVDVYALGVLFYYMLSGRRPFHGDSDASVLYRTVNDPPPNLREHLPPGHRVPRSLADLIHRCLEKDRALRPPDADALTEELIDVVPASLFRLPRRHTARSGIPPTYPPGAGNTGLMQMVGLDRSPSAPHPVGALRKRGRWFTRSLLAAGVLGCVALVASVGDGLVTGSDEVRVAAAALSPAPQLRAAEQPPPRRAKLPPPPPPDAAEDPEPEPETVIEIEPERDPPSTRGRRSRKTEPSKARRPADTSALKPKPERKAKTEPSSAGATVFLPNRQPKHSTVFLPRESP